MTPGVIRAVCTSQRKGTIKTAVETACAVARHGLEGDAHAGDWHRQLSLLTEEDVDTMRARGLELSPGAFGENLVIEGLGLAELGLGSRLRAGEVELAVSQLGKVCHTRCAIYHRTGDCIMPRTGVFTEVVTGGELRPGLPVEVVEAVSRETVQAAVLTVSDTCAAGAATDTAGPATADLLRSRLGARVVWAGVEPDDRGRLAGRLKELAGRRLDLVVTTGGTGCGPRDVTPEATLDVIEREAPGLAEAMRDASMSVTHRAMLQRGVAGICRQTLILNLPGSRRGAEENLEAVLPALGHAVRLLRGDTAHDADPRPGTDVVLPALDGAFGGSTRRRDPGPGAAPAPDDRP